MDPAGQCDLGHIPSLVKFSIFRGGAQIRDPGSKTQTRVLIIENFLELSLYPLENRMLFLTNGWS